MPESTPYQTSSQRRVRGRAVACRDCRNKKLKCDLEYPVCGRCNRSKAVSQCVYDNGIPSQSLKSKIASRRGNRAVDTTIAHRGSSEPRPMISTVRAPKEGHNVMQWKSNSPQISQEAGSDTFDSPGNRHSFNTPQHTVIMN
jgi:hypothetical protein